MGDLIVEEGRIGHPLPEGALNLLIIAPSPPYPPNWGFAQRNFQLARTLAAGHRVTILTYWLEDQGPDVRAMADYVHRVIAVPAGRSGTAHRRSKQARSLLSPLPHHAGSLRSARMQQVVDRLLREESFDLVQLESSQLGWLRLPDGLPVVVDEHNIESELLGRMGRSERSAPRRWFNAYDAVRYRRFEESVWRAASGRAVTSPRDAEALADRCGPDGISVVPNGVDLSYFQPTDTRPDPDRLVFTGLLDYRPNYDGLLWFLEEVFPRIREGRPDLRLTVAGAGEEAVLSSLRRSGVDVMGRVPDLRPHLARAAVVVVPLRIGGGTRLKLVEAMAMGKPIVSTPLGAEGVAVRSGEHVLLAEGSSDFGAAVGELLDDRALRIRLGSAARALAEQGYSWQRSARELEALYAQVLSREAVG